MGRDNATWLIPLSDSGPKQQRVLSLLRAELLGRLRRAFWNRGQIDEAFLEDAVQEALMRILDRLDQFEGRSQFLTWATAIAIRVAMSELRKRHWQEVSLDELVADTDFSPDWATEGEIGPALQWERKAILDTVHEVIQNELTAKQRTALIAELKGMPQEEIARHMRSNRNAVYKLTHDARKRLKYGLEAAGYAAADIHTTFTA